MRSETRYYCKGTIIVDSREEAKGLMVITSGQVWWNLFYCIMSKPYSAKPCYLLLLNVNQVGAELPVDSDDADAENQSEGRTLLFVFERG